MKKPQNPLAILIQLIFFTVSWNTASASEPSEPATHIRSTKQNAAGPVAFAIKALGGFPASTITADDRTQYGEIDELYIVSSLVLAENALSCSFDWSLGHGMATQHIYMPQPAPDAVVNGGSPQYNCVTIWGGLKTAGVPNIPGNVHIQNLIVATGPNIHIIEFDLLGNSSQPPSSSITPPSRENALLAGTYDLVVTGIDASEECRTRPLQQSQHISFTLAHADGDYFRPVSNGALRDLGGKLLDFKAVPCHTGSCEFKSENEEVGPAFTYEGQGSVRAYSNHSLTIKVRTVFDHSSQRLRPQMELELKNPCAVWHTDYYNFYGRSTWWDQRTTDFLGWKN